MTPEVDSRRYGTTNPKRSGHEHVRRQVRRALAKTAGKGKTDRRRVGESNGTTDANPVRLGIYKVLSPSETPTVTCRNIGDYGTKSFAKRIISRNLRKSAIPPIAKIRKSDIISHVTLGDSGFRFPESIETETSQYCPPNVTWSNAGSFRFNTLNPPNPHVR